ncbi:MAG: hypothetical protein WC249_01050 [Patescibacteria group bacterium]|jgi:2,3-bisphosphoglycerate-independent phosphoglycerate mutase
MITKNTVDSDVAPEIFQKHRPVVLLLIDGWGVTPANEFNATTLAKTPVFLNLIKEYPVALLSPGVGSWNARYLTIGAGQEIVSEDTEPAVTLTAVLAAAKLKQIKISETERFAALTYFFNGRAEQKMPGEEWKIISSVGGQAAVRPSLALQRTVKEIIKTIEADEPFDFIVAAVPFLDLVAAGGDLAVVKKAVELLDKNLRPILTAVESRNGVLIISAAGGNAERMCHPGTDLVDNRKTNNPVPIIIIGSEFEGKTIGLSDPLNNDLNLLASVGTLADLAPTILQIMNLNKPIEMTGQGLLCKN